MSAHPIIIGGDPHGKHSEIIGCCLEQQAAGTLILLGDCELEAPLRQVYAAVLDAGWRLRWIIGNHEKDHEHWHDNLVEDAPEWNLHGSVIEADGLRIGGLGGVFKGNVWYPREGSEARWSSPEHFVKECRRSDLWRKGLPLGQRDTIFPVDVIRASKLRLDVLVTHEAPRGTHRNGFQALDDVADACGARLLVHGHHHRPYAATATLKSGRTLHVRCVEIGKPWILEMPDD